MSANFYAEAMSRLRPGERWGLSPADELQIDPENPNIISNLWWPETNFSSPPTVEEIQDMAAICHQEHIDKEYQRQRDPEYPPLTVLADAIYWQSKGDNSKMEAYLAAVEAVKNKYPKP